VNAFAQVIRLNTNKTKQNKTKQNTTKDNTTQQNKQNKTKQNKTQNKQNKTNLSKLLAISCSTAPIITALLILEAPLITTLYHRTDLTPLLNASKIRCTVAMKLK
jgi:hypothetical protein